MKRIVLSFVLFISMISVFGDDIAITINDFTIESSNPSHKYIGKGLSRLVAGELRKSPKIKIIEREKLAKILEEQELSLSAFSDASKQVEIGRLLSANYIIMGEIIDMDNTLLLSLRMVSVATSEVVWQEDITEKLETYDYIAAYFAGSVLKSLNLQVKDSIVAKVEKKEIKKEEAIIVLSEGIDSYDKGETDKAKKKLEEAKKIDPENEVASFYLSKLVLNTSKFKTITEQYYPVQNPAYLGIIQYDRFYLTFGWNTIILGNEDERLPIEEYDPLLMHEGDTRISAGYDFPLLQNMGLGIGYFFYSRTDEIYDPVNHPTDSSGSTGNGGIVSIGWAPAEFFSIGITASLYVQIREGFSASEGSTVEYEDPPHFYQAFSGGMLVKIPDTGVIFDIFAGYSLEKTLYLNPATFPNPREDAIERSAPLFVENTLTISLLENKMFITLKQLNDVFLETGYYYGRIIPACEFWLFDWLSLRAGFEGSFMKLEESNTFGFGGTGGFSIRIIPWGLDVDLNVTYRKRPSRFIDNEFIDEIIPLITVSKTKTFINR